MTEDDLKKLMADKKDHERATVTGTSVGGYIDANIGLRPCPSCGRCPTCGLGGYNTPYQPWWAQIYPYYRPTYTYGSLQSIPGTLTYGTVSVGSTDGAR